MNDLLQDFIDYFTSSGITDAMFKDVMLDQPDTAIAVYEYQGDAGLPQVEGAYRPCQIVVRDSNPTTAKQKANTLYHLLSTEDGELKLTTQRWTSLSPKEPPFKLKVDSQQRVYYCFNVHVTTYED